MLCVLEVGLNRIVFGLVCLFLLNSVSHAGFVAADYKLADYKQIRANATSSGIAKTQRLMLEARVAGIYFSMREESLSLQYLSKLDLFCIKPNDHSFDVKSFLDDLDNEVQHNPNYYPSMTITRAVRALVIKRNPC